MSARCAALLRGINVGTAKRIAMADLRRVVEAAGGREVRTLLNSGNVAFTAPPGGAPAALRARIEELVAERLGVITRVTVLPAPALARMVAENPFTGPAVDPSRLLLLVLAGAAAAATLRPLAARTWGGERLALGKGVAYLWCRDGISRGRLWLEADRAVGQGGTARNLATMRKLLALVEGPPD